MEFYSTRINLNEWRHDKYCININFWIATTNHNASYTWKTLLKARQWCKGVVDRKIVNGEHTDIWTDAWINGYSIVDKYGWKTMAVTDGNHRKVSSLISANKRKNCMDNMPTQIQNTMQSIKIRNQKQNDFWFWIPSNDGQFNTKSTWNYIRNKHFEFNWAKMIWDRNHAPKMSICALLAKLNRLNNKYRIGRWNNAIDQACVLCVNQNEDRDHLFFNCPYSRQIIEDIMFKLQINIENSFEINQILEKLFQNQSNNQFPIHFMNIALTTLIWHIWCERNAWVFKGIELHDQVRITLINQDCK